MPSVLTRPAASGRQNFCWRPLLFCLAPNLQGHFQACALFKGVRQERLVRHCLPGPLAARRQRSVACWTWAPLWARREACTKASRGAVQRRALHPFRCHFGASPCHVVPAAGACACDSRCARCSAMPLSPCLPADIMLRRCWRNLVATTTTNDC